MTARTTDEAIATLLDRVRQRLPDRPIRQVPMFGTVALMVDESMVVAVRKDAGLLVHVLPDDDAELLARPETSRPEMGRGRSMGIGWLQVEGGALRDDAVLDLWMHHALRRLADPS